MDLEFHPVVVLRKNTHQRQEQELKNAVGEIDFDAEETQEITKTIDFRNNNVNEALVSSE